MKSSKGELPPLNPNNSLRRRLSWQMMNWTSFALAGVADMPLMCFTIETFPVLPCRGSRKSINHNFVKSLLRLLSFVKIQSTHITLARHMPSLDACTGRIPPPSSSWADSGLHGVEVLCGWRNPMCDGKRRTRDGAYVLHRDEIRKGVWAIAGRPGRPLTARGALGRLTTHLYNITTKP